MKKLLSSIIILLAFCFACPPAVFASDPTPQTVQLRKKNKQKSDHEGIRIPSRFIVCIISAEGIQMDVEAEEILSYEIWDADGEVCIASYTEESDFINALFSLEGEYQIQFTTEDYVYIGYISNAM